MMRPITVAVNTVAPAASTLGASGTPGSNISLTWDDPTPGSSPMTLGNMSNEIGYRVERADGTVGPFTFGTVGNALANKTSFVDDTTVAGQSYTYRVVAYSAGGETPSNEVQVTP